MFKAERVFSHRNPETGLIQWFFHAREGNIGPFSSKKQATEELKFFIKTCIENGDDGGRKSDKKNTKLSLVPMHDVAYMRKK